MKGIIFNLLEEVVTQEEGEAAWDGLLEDAKLEGAYSSIATYPDEELSALVASASKLLGMPADDIVRWFGRKAIPLLSQRFPEFFDAHASTSAFLLTLNEIIHAEVRKLYPDAELPYFEIAAPEEGVMTLAYASPRHLCSLAEGFIEGSSEHFGEHLEIKQTVCMKRGDNSCLLVCKFSR